MERLFKVKVIKGIKLLFIAQGYDVLVVSDTGDFYGAFQSVENAESMIHSGAAGPLCKRQVTVRG